MGAVSDATPAPGTTRYSCPLDCDWHYDVPPPGAARVAELGVVADPEARDIHEAITSVAHQAATREAELTEQAVRDHLAAHSDPASVEAVQQMLADAGVELEWPPPLP